MKERIRTVMDYAKLSQQDFAAKLGISAASLSGIFTGRSNPTNNHVMAIHHAFPEINVSWLMFGEGEMIVRSLEADMNGQEGVSRLGQPEGIGLFADLQDNSSSSVDSLTEEVFERNKAFIEGDNPVIRQYLRTKAEVMAGRKNVDIKPRKIKEIRVFFDDGTYESFAPMNK